MKKFASRSSPPAMYVLVAIILAITIISTSVVHGSEVPAQDTDAAVTLPHPADGGRIRRGLAPPSPTPNHGPHLQPAPPVPICCL
ncbi:unnamed protein product [Urochloa decumbens]|uniref:Uncharacterized protein n=1 Tax=Urochloa decumbens TaxID=240449 RepID=A0ABC8ZAX1_9POAL